MDHLFAHCQTAAEVKATFRLLAKQYHPDKGGSKEEFQDLQAAYERALAWAPGAEEPSPPPPPPRPQCSECARPIPRSRMEANRFVQHTCSAKCSKKRNDRIKKERAAQYMRAYRRRKKEGLV